MKTMIVQESLNKRLRNWGMLLLQIWCWEDQNLKFQILILEWAWWINLIHNLNISNNSLNNNQWVKGMNFSKGLSQLRKWSHNHSLRNKRLILLTWDKRESKGNWINITRIKLFLQFVINKEDNQIHSKMNRSNRSIVSLFYKFSESRTFGWWKSTKGRTLNPYLDWVDLQNDFQQIVDCSRKRIGWIGNTNSKT